MNDQGYTVPSPNNESVQKELAKLLVYSRFLHDGINRAVLCGIDSDVPKEIIVEISTRFKTNEIKTARDQIQFFLGAKEKIVESLCSTNILDRSIILNSKNNTGNK